MKVAFITRSTLYTVYGGGAVQIFETAKHLQALGVEVTIFLSHEKVNYNEFDLLHFFDIIRPANILYHIKKSNKPFVLSPILVDYSEYDKKYRKGFSGFVFRLFSPDTNEYIKSITRWLSGKDSLPSKEYIWKGHKKSVCEILKKAQLILPNSESEYRQLNKLYRTNKSYVIVPNGINENIFLPNGSIMRDEKLVICAARIEGIKNQLNLIKALNNTEFKLILVGDASPNQKQYYTDCKNIAGNNIQFLSKISQANLAVLYQKAKVHVLPSWFETCGLSSLEAAAMGCNIVITDKGYTRDYFGNDAFYCDPGKPESIYKSVEAAANAGLSKQLQQKIFQKYTWRQAALITSETYKKIISI